MRRLRESQRLTQERLALGAEISQRHLSFLENGRANPSRATVRRLADYLELSPNESDRLLLAAGFAPAPLPPRSSAPRPGARAIPPAVHRVIESLDPFPAFVLDGRREILLANSAAREIAAVELGGVNVYRLLLHPEGIADRILGFPAFASVVLARLHRDAAAVPSLAALYAELAALPGLREAAAASVSSHRSVEFRLRHEGRVLAFVSTLATCGDPHAAREGDYVIESLHPADSETRAALAAI